MKNTRHLYIFTYFLFFLNITNNKSITDKATDNIKTTKKRESKTAAMGGQRKQKCRLRRASNEITEGVGGANGGGGQALLVFDRPTIALGSASIHQTLRNTEVKIKSKIKNKKKQKQNKKKKHEDSQK